MFLFIYFLIFYLILESHEIWVLNVVSCYFFYSVSSGFSAQFCFQKDCFKAKVCIYRRLEESWYTVYPLNSCTWVQLGECWSAEWEVAGTNTGRTNTRARPTPWPDQHPGQTNTLAGPTPRPDQHPGRTNTLAGPTPWPDQHPGRTNTLAGPTLRVFK